jgi:hypothetical protein
MVELDPRRRCPHCRLRFEAQDGLEPGQVPMPGSVAICGGCGGISVYQVGPARMLSNRRRLTVRAPTAEELEAAEADPRVRWCRLALGAAADSRAAVPIWRLGLGGQAEERGLGYRRRGGDR